VGTGSTGSRDRCVLCRRNESDAEAEEEEEADAEAEAEELDG
jgi:hypothetical protein